VAGTEITAAYISRIESGQRRPTQAVLRLIASRLDTSAEWLLTGVEAQDAADIELTLRYAELALKSGEAADARSELQKLLDRDDTLGPLRPRVLWLMGLALEVAGELEAAIAWLEELRSMPTAMSPLLVGTALSRCYRDAGDLARAIDVAEDARRLAAEAGLTGTDDEIRLTMTLVAAYQERGDRAYAAHLCNQALIAAEAHGSAPARAAVYWNASILAKKRARPAEAVTLADRALLLLSEGEDDRNLARLRAVFGLLLLEQDPPDVGGAEKHLSQSQDELRARDGSVVDLARGELGLARCFLLRGDLDEALRRASIALEGATGSSPSLSADAQAVIGRIAAARGDLPAACDHFRTAAALMTAAQADREAAALWFQLGELLDSSGDATGARDAFRSAAAATGLRVAGVRGVVADAAQRSP
jgi:tetratricopeptide (TPR) repeat protein